MDEPVVWYEGAGTAGRRWLHADERGSVVAVSDASGNAIAINRYDEYGIPASTNLGRFGYTGQAWLSEIGMSYYKARMYSPTLGRFMQTDPIGYGDGINWYNYVRSDPVNFVDPTGLACASFNGDPCGEIVVTGDRGGVDFDFGGILGGGGGRIVLQRQVMAADRGGRRPQSGPCSTIPSPGPGKATLDSNIADAALDAKVNAADPFKDPFGLIDNFNNLEQLSINVTTASRQNYKANPAYRGSAGYGNFNFGATMQARGYSLSTTLGGSNAFQRLTTGRADPPEDVRDVTNGYKYAQAGCNNR